MERSVQIAIEHILWCRSQGMGRGDIADMIQPGWRAASWDDLVWWIADQWEALPHLRDAA